MKKIKFVSIHYLFEFMCAVYFLKSSSCVQEILSSYVTWRCNIVSILYWNWKLCEFNL